MKHIFIKTIAKMFKIIPVILYMIVSLLCGFMLANTYRNYVKTNYATFNGLTSTLISTLTIIIFLIICGLLLITLVVMVGSGLFAGEEMDGTMRLLVAKPVSRFEIVVGKIAGLLCGSFIYLVSSIGLMMTIFVMLSTVDGEVMKIIVGYIPGYLLFGMILIFIFSALSCLLSLLFKKRIPTMIILLFVMVALFGMIPILRLFLKSGGSYDQYHMYLFDINYHIGLIFYQCMSLCGGMILSSSQMSNIGIFLGIYSFRKLDYDIISSSFQTNDYVLNQYLNGNSLLLIYLLIAVGCYLLCYLRMKKKDIVT